MFTELRMKDPLPAKPGARGSAPSLALAAVVISTAALAAGCGSSSTPAAQTVTVTASPTATATETVTDTVTASESPSAAGTGTSSGPSQSTGGGVSRERAKQIALNHIGQGRVTDIGREDDFGAMWEVEVTRPNGSEVDVYVSADGRVVHTT